MPRTRDHGGRVSPVSPRTPAEQVAALSALSGFTPDPSMRRNLAMVVMIAKAQERGVTWNQIASAIGAENGRAAKAQAKRLAKGCQSALLASLIEQRAAVDAG